MDTVELVCNSLSDGLASIEGGCAAHHYYHSAPTTLSTHSFTTLSQQQTPTLVTMNAELQRLIDGEDYHAIISYVDAQSSSRTATTTAGEGDATTAKQLKYIKAVALVSEGEKLEDVLHLLQPIYQESFQLTYVYAYTLYRQRQYKQALDVLQQTTVPSDADDAQWYYHLLAQIHYRLSQYAECSSIYEQHLSSSISDDVEVATNVLAAYIGRGHSDAAAWQTGKQLAQKLDVSHTSDHYELSYNTATLYAESQDVVNALRFIEQSQRIARLELATDDDSELESELSAITTQHAYMLSLIGDQAAASTQYKRALATKDGDAAAQSIAKSNLNALSLIDGDRASRAQSLLHASKRSITSILSNDKLIDRQKVILAANAALAHMRHSRIEQAKSIVKQLREKITHADDYEVIAVVEASLQLSAKQQTEAEATLQKYIKSHPQQSTQAQLALIHLQLMTDKHATSTTVQRLSELARDSASPLYCQPAALATLAQLYNSQSQPASDTAVQSLLRDATAFWRQHTSDSSLAARNHVTLAQQFAKHAAQHQQWQAAADTYKQLIEFAATPESDAFVTEQRKFQWISQLVQAAKRIDATTAQKYVQTLLPTTNNQSVDTSQLPSIDVLESTLPGLPGHQVKGKSTTSGSTKAVTGTFTSSKKKANKRKRLPSSYDAALTPDPERWLPKYERTKQKNRRRTGGANQYTGSQGSVPTSTAASSSSSTAGSGTIAESKVASDQPSAAARQAAQKKKQKKGRK